MATTVSELLVRIRPDGVSDTTNELAEQSNQFEETASTAETQTGKLETFSKRWQGALSVVATGLAVASGALLSQVPVLGEVFGGLQAIVEGVAYQMDQVLRPILQPLATGMYELGNAIATTDGFLGDLIGVIASVVSFVAVIGGAIASVAAYFTSWATVGSAVSTVLAAVVTALKVVGGAIAAIIGGISALTAALIAIVVAIIAFAVAYLTNWKGVRDKTDSFIGDIIDAVSNLADKGVEFLKNFFSGVVEWLSDADDYIGEFVEGVAEWFGGLVDSAAQWGRDLVGRFIEAVQSKISEAGGVIGEIGASLTGGGGGSGTSGSGSTGSSGGSGGGPRGPQSQSTRVYLEGRDVTRETSQYRADETYRRGRY